jgi:hypothetical protein
MSDPKPRARFSGGKASCAIIPPLHENPAARRQGGNACGRGQSIRSFVARCADMDKGKKHQTGERYLARHAGRSAPFAAIRLGCRQPNSRSCERRGPAREAPNARLAPQAEELPGARDWQAQRRDTPCVGELRGQSAETHFSRPLPGLSAKPSPGRLYGGALCEGSRLNRTAVGNIRRCALSGYEYGAARRLRRRQRTPRLLPATMLVPARLGLSGTAPTAAARGRETLPFQVASRNSSRSAPTCPASPGRLYGGALCEAGQVVAPLLASRFAS